MKKKKRNARFVKALCVILTIAIVFPLMSTRTTAFPYAYTIPDGFDSLQGWVEVRLIGSEAEGANTVKPETEKQVYVELWAFGLISNFGAISIGYNPTALKPSLIQEYQDEVNNITYPVNTLVESIMPATDSNIKDRERYELAVAFSGYGVYGQDNAPLDPGLATLQPDTKIYVGDVFETDDRYTALNDMASAASNYVVLQYQLAQHISAPSNSGEQILAQTLWDDNVLIGVSENPNRPQYGINLGENGVCIMRASFRRMETSTSTEASPEYIPLTPESIWIQKAPEGVSTLTDLSTGIYVHNGATNTQTTEGGKWFITDASRVPLILEGVMAAPDPLGIEATNPNTGFNFYVNVKEVTLYDGTKKKARDAVAAGDISGFVVYTPDGVRIEVAGALIEVGNANPGPPALLAQSDDSITFEIKATATSSYINYISDGAPNTAEPTAYFQLSCIKMQDDGTNVEGKRVDFKLPAIKGAHLSFELTSYAPQHITSVWLYKQSTTGIYETLPHLYTTVSEATGVGQSTATIDLEHVACGDYAYRIVIEKAGHIRYCIDDFLVVTAGATDSDPWTATVKNGTTVSCVPGAATATALLDGSSQPMTIELICGDVNPWEEEIPDPSNPSDPPQIVDHYGDGAVNLADRTCLQTYINRDKSGGTVTSAGSPGYVMDLDGDGKVTMADLDVLERNFCRDSSEYQ